MFTKCAVAVGMHMLGHKEVVYLLPLGGAFAFRFMYKITIYVLERRW